MRLEFFRKGLGRLSPGGGGGRWRGEVYSTSEGVFLLKGVVHQRGFSYSEV